MMTAPPRLHRTRPSYAWRGIAISAAMACSTPSIPGEPCAVSPAPTSPASALGGTILCGKERCSAEKEVCCGSRTSDVPARCAKRETSPRVYRRRMSQASDWRLRSDHLWRRRAGLLPRLGEVVMVLRG